LAKRQEQLSDHEEDEEEYEDDFHPGTLNIAAPLSAPHNELGESTKRPPLNQVEEPEELVVAPKRAKVKQPLLNKSEPDFSLINLKNSPKGTAQNKRKEARDD